jgi:hypothetical protein
VYVLLPVKVNVPAPSFVTAKAVEPLLIIPVIKLAPELVPVVALKVPEELIATAFNESVIIVSPVKLLTVLANVTSPVAFAAPPFVTVNELVFPATVELNKIVPFGADNVGLPVIKVTVPV